MSENKNFNGQINEELLLNQNQNNNIGQYNNSNQNPNHPFNNIQEPLINSENIQINLNQNGILSSYQSNNNIEDKTNQENQISISPPFTNDQNNMNNFPNNNNIQQNIEMNQNINGNFQNNNNYNNPYNNPQMNYQPNFQQNNALQAQTRNNNRCCRYKPYECAAIILGTMIGLSLFFFVTHNWY